MPAFTFLRNWMATRFLDKLRFEHAHAEHMYGSGDSQGAGDACIHILKKLDGRTFAGAQGTVADTLRADTLTLLGTLYNVHEFFEKGSLCFREAMAAYERARGKDDLYVHIASSNLAISLQGMERQEEAIQALKAASVGMERNLNIDPRAVSELARTLGTLGAVQTQAGHLSEAKASLEDAIRRSASIGDGKTVEDFVIEANHYNSLGNVFRLEGQALRSMSAIESAVAKLAPFWEGYRPLVEHPMAAFVQNYDNSKREAEVTEDARVVAKYRAML